MEFCEHKRKDSNRAWATRKGFPEGMRLEWRSINIRITSEIFHVLFFYTVFEIQYVFHTCNTLRSGPATSQLLRRHTWLVDTVLESSGLTCPEPAISECLLCARYSGGLTIKRCLCPQRAQDKSIHSVSSKRKQTQTIQNRMPTGVGEGFGEREDWEYTLK